MLTTPATIRLRSLARSLGLTELLGGLFSGNRYEARFGSAFQSNIRTGDAVWDVGANVGLYTALFAEATGPEGRVIAFEPTEACFLSLSRACSKLPWVVLKNMALGSEDGTLSMQVQADGLAATHRVVLGGPADGALVEVPVRSGGSLVRDDPGLFPNVIKIDVEGHEGAVLEGLKPMLGDVRLRCLGIEVHFGLLEERGERDCPTQIVGLLKEKGFRVHWTDPSHLLATR